MAKKRKVSRDVVKKNVFKRPRNFANDASTLLSRIKRRTPDMLFYTRFGPSSLLPGQWDAIRPALTDFEKRPMVLRGCHGIGKTNVALIVSYQLRATTFILYPHTPRDEFDSLMRTVLAKDILIIDDAEVDIAQTKLALKKHRRTILTQTNYCKGMESLNTVVVNLPPIPFDTCYEILCKGNFEVFGNKVTSRTKARRLFDDCNGDFRRFIQTAMYFRDVCNQGDSVLNMSALERMKILREGTCTQEMRECACDDGSVALLHMFAKPLNQSDLCRWTDMFSAIDLGISVDIVAVSCGKIKCKSHQARRYTKDRDSSKILGTVSAKTPVRMKQASDLLDLCFQKIAAVNK